METSWWWKDFGLRCHVLYLVGLLILSLSLAQNTDDTAVVDQQEFPCHSLGSENKTCSNCVQQHPTCAWCSQDGFDDDNRYTRCDTENNLKKHGCLQHEIFNPKKVKDIQKDDPLSNAGVGRDEEAVQIRPQRIRIKIRPNDRETFQVTFKQARDYPVDLYYLMDLSQSMSDDKERLSKLGQDLGARMKVITNNFKMGFGSFVDKKLMPFVDTRPEKLEKPCSEAYDCVAAYGFKNHMKLDINAEKFSEEVSKAAISGNLDAPEGGLDAMMQALACGNEIGWRNKSRKMVVYSTDAGFHYAGDGRLAGVVVPNDATCHLDREGFYTMSLEQDYPSIAQVHKKIRDVKANVIFAVTKEQVPLYKRLKDALPDVQTSVGELKNDSRNVIELIEHAYNQISERIVMVNNANASLGIHISYKTACKGKVKNDTNVCDGIKVGDEITYDVTLEVSKCTDQQNFDIEIGPAGLTESVLVKVSVICNCGCSSPNHDTYEANSEDCNNRGNKVCGVCQCDEGFLGQKCECVSGGETRPQLEAKCKRTEDSPICEGRGQCVCGQCKCNEMENFPQNKISGKFCECDNFNCPRHNRKICAGNGRCECSQCICNPGFTGRACECPVSQDSCRASNGKICNGKGTCECGICNCKNDTRYSGPTCEDCPTCPTNCVEYRPCVMCQQFKTGPYNTSQCLEKCPFIGIPVDELPNLNGTVSCQFVDKDDCTFYFMYDYDEDTGNVTVWVKKDKDCPPTPPILAIALGVIAGIVLIGLILLLVWKLLTILHDRREFARFEKERLMAKWDTQKYSYFLNEDEDTGNVTVWVKKDKDCPPTPPILAIALGVIAGIVLIGLILLLVWKLLTILHDRREFARFEKERLMAKWDTGENPIFHPATTTFKNPAYGGRN